MPCSKGLLYEEVSNEKLNKQYQIVDRSIHIRNYGADIVLVAVPEFGLIPSAAPLYGQVAEEYNIPVEMDIVPSLERRPAFKSDAIHFNKAGYAEMAKAIVALLHKHNAI